MQLLAALRRAVAPTPLLPPAALLKEGLQLAVLEVVPGQVKPFDNQQQPVHGHDAQGKPFDRLRGGPLTGQRHISGMAAQAGLGGHQTEYRTIMPQARPMIGGPIGAVFLHFSG